MAGDKGVRLSLAGAQDKIALFFDGVEFFLPLCGAPSTHILKPANEHFEGVVFNEALCMKLALAIGLSVAKVKTGKIQNIDYLQIERYDRKITEPLPEVRTDSQVWKRIDQRNVQEKFKQHAVRLHQEDFCQALGLPPEKKYQAEEGPSLKQCFELVRETSSAPVIDLQSLLDGVIFNYLIGNHDAHGKNFSFVYFEENELQTRLAPFYDLLSTVYYPNLTKKMAMKIGGEYQSSKISPKHFEQLAEDTGLAKPIVRQRIPELAKNILANLESVKIDHKVAKEVANLIRKKCEETIEEFGG